jgi:ribosomal-protein-alanine N-acetyltransferase
LYRTLFEESELLTLGVVPSARRRGVAAALLGHWIGAMRGDGCRRLLLEVSARNQAARALYEQAGFQVYATRQGYYADGAAALLLELALTGAA